MGEVKESVVGSGSGRMGYCHPLSVVRKKNPKTDNLVKTVDLIYKTQKQIFKAYLACLGPFSAGPDLKV